MLAIIFIYRSLAGPERQSDGDRSLYMLKIGLLNVSNNLPAIFPHC